MRLLPSRIIAVWQVYGILSGKAMFLPPIFGVDSNAFSNCVQKVKCYMADNMVIS
jgi:hypothetical protein